LSLISFTPLSDGVTAVNAAATNTPLSTIYNDYNGNITDANIASNAAIAGSKVNLASISNPYKFSVYRNAALAIASNAVVIYDTKVFDTGTNFSTVTGLFTAPVAGFYKFDAAIGFASSASFIFNIGLQKNASGTLLFGNQFNGTSNNQDIVINSPPIQLSANDTIGVIFGSNNGGNTTINVGSNTVWFGGYLISAT